MFLANMLCWYHSSEKKQRIVIPRIIYKLIQFIERKRRCLGVNEKYIKTAISDTSASECKEMQKSNKGGDKQYFFKLRTICYKKIKIKNWELNSAWDTSGPLGHVCATYFLQMQKYFFRGFHFQLFGAAGLSMENPYFIRFFCTKRKPMSDPLLSDFHFHWSRDVNRVVLDWSKLKPAVSNLSHPNPTCPVIGH